jgi:hypothetical protein
MRASVRIRQTDIVVAKWAPSRPSADIVYDRFALHPYQFCVQIVNRSDDSGRLPELLNIPTSEQCLLFSTFELTEDNWDAQSTWVSASIMGLKTTSKVTETSKVETLNYARGRAIRSPIVKLCPESSGSYSASWEPT